MKPLTKQEKQKILSRLFWDLNVSPTDMDKLLDEKLKSIDSIDSRQFFSRLLTSCDWYTLLRILPPETLKTILNDKILDRLYPKDLKDKYIYARQVLSR